MLLYFLRHAEAQSLSQVGDDYSRKLTGNGVSTLQLARERILASLEEVEKIQVSPYLRTIQTADVLLENSQVKDYEINDLLRAENWDQDSLYEHYKNLENKNVFIISHEPQIRSLMEALLGQDSPNIYTASFHCIFWDQANFAKLIFSIPAKYLQGEKR